MLSNSYTCPTYSRFFYLILNRNKFTELDKIKNRIHNNKTKGINDDSSLLTTQQESPITGKRQQDLFFPILMGLVQAFKLQIICQIRKDNHTQRLIALFAGIATLNNICIVELRLRHSESLPQVLQKWLYSDESTIV